METMEIMDTMDSFYVLYGRNGRCDTVWKISGMLFNQVLFRQYYSGKDASRAVDDPYLRLAVGILAQIIKAVLQFSTKLLQSFHL